MRHRSIHLFTLTFVWLGDHYISVKWDDFPLPSTPYLGHATGPPPDTNGGLFRPVLLNINQGSPRFVKMKYSKH